MNEDDLKNNAVEILKMKYEAHTEDLHWRENYNMRLVSGFATLHIVLGAWLSQHPLNETVHKCVFTAFVVVVTWAVCALVNRNYTRRKEVVDTILSINRALKFSEPDIYWEEQLDPPSKPKLDTWVKPQEGSDTSVTPAVVYWKNCYLMTVCIFAAAQLVMIWWPVVTVGGASSAAHLGDDLLRSVVATHSVQMASP
jgi:hypothetical protein